LENALERAVLLAPDGGEVESVHLFPQARPEGASTAAGGVDAEGRVTEASGADALGALCEQALEHHIDLESIETRLMQLAMQRAKGNLSQAARLLGITRPQLAYRLKKQGIPGA
jgi:DNA-binding NtrC family response regulator